MRFILRYNKLVESVSRDNVFNTNPRVRRYLSRDNTMFLIDIDTL